MGVHRPICDELRFHLLFSKRKHGILLLESYRYTRMGEKMDVKQGTLALMVLKTLDVLGPLHGWGIAGGSSRSVGICSR